MEHYLCTGSCGGISPVSKVCESETCSKFNQEMILCKCDTGKHEGILIKCKNCNNFIPLGTQVCPEGKCSI